MALSVVCPSCGGPAVQADVGGIFCPRCGNEQRATRVLTLIDEGKATAYGQGVMSTVVQNRLKWGHLTQEQVDRAIGFVALQENHIGKECMMELPSGEWVGPFLVADCGAEKDQERLDDINFAIDLAYPLAVKYLKNPRTPLHGVKVWLISGNTGENENGD